MRTLLADGRLVEESGVYVPRGDLTNLAVPETLTALIAARLDTLDETDRRIVHDAAVLGQSFTLAALAAVAGVPEDELEPRLTSLVRRELLQREMDARSPETRPVRASSRRSSARWPTTRSPRRTASELHLAAARYFESLGNDEIAGALASHYLAAHANAGEGAEADALATQARIALKAAAARATALGGYSQAANFLEQAAAVTSDESEQAALLEQAGTAAQTAGRIADAEALLRRSLASEGQDRRPERRGKSYWLFGLDVEFVVPR